jgi:hypothetical protein
MLIDYYVYLLNSFNCKPSSNIFVNLLSYGKFFVSSNTKCLKLSGILEEGLQLKEFNK